MTLLLTAACGAQPAPKSVSGKLLAASRQAVIVHSQGRKLTVPLHRKTSVSVRGTASQEVLRKGMILRASGTSDPKKFYIIRNASLTWYYGHRPRRNGFKQDIPTQQLTVTGVVKKTNPLTIQADASCPQVTLSRAGNRVVKLPVRGRLFQVTPRTGATIAVDFGKNVRYAGKQPPVKVELFPNGRFAKSVRVERPDTITAKDLPGGKKKKKKKKPEKKPTPEKKPKPKKKSSDDRKPKPSAKKPEERKNKPSGNTPAKKDA